MKTRAMFTLGMSVLVLGGAMSGYAGEGFSAIAGTRDTTKAAANAFDKARASLAKGNADAAVRYGEQAVGYDPQVAAYRVLLGQSYLKAGRFASAHAAFADALTLDPTNGKAALHLALAEIAEGNWNGARQVLDANSTIIAVSDRGLAIALAGDPAAAVELLATAARAPEADAKTRQNYALALALAGRWQEAKTIVAMDVAPDQVDARIMQWASFAKPASASDQVASLLGVTPVNDPGQPVALALATTPGVGLAAATPVEPVAVAEAPDAAPDAPAMPVAASVSNVSFGARDEVIQPLPPRAVPPKPRAAVIEKPKPAMGEAVAPRVPAKGNFFVQLGAFDNAAVAKDAWRRMARANPGLAAHSPSGMPISTKAGAFYRLSLGGFARGDAEALCQSYKAKGGKCFVRAGAGDKAVAWVKPVGVKPVGVKLASR